MTQNSSNVNDNESQKFLLTESSPKNKFDNT